MKSKRISLILMIGLFAKGVVFGQSFAYKTLLQSYYDKDFPVVYPDQKDILSKAVLIDTRELEEFAVSHLENARFVGYKTFELSTVSDISNDQPIVVYCSIGVRSQDIGKKLVEAGYKEVYNLYGGIFHWVNQGYPVYASDRPTQNVHAYSRTWGIWLKQGEKVY